MEELLDDIKLHMDLDSAKPIHVEYWEALMVVCRWELDRAMCGGERGLHYSIEEEVRELLQGMNYVELKGIDY